VCVVTGQLQAPLSPLRTAVSVARQPNTFASDYDGAMNCCDWGSSGRAPIEAAMCLWRTLGPSVDVNDHRERLGRLVSPEWVGN
jgi:hypothetical protein